MIYHVSGHTHEVCKVISWKNGKALYIFMVNPKETSSLVIHETFILNNVYSMQVSHFHSLRTNISSRTIYVFDRGYISKECLLLSNGRIPHHSGLPLPSSQYPGALGLDLPAQLMTVKVVVYTIPTHPNTHRAISATFCFLLWETPLRWSNG